MASVNKVILVGNLGKDPEVRYVSDNVPVANFSLATSETYKDRTTGERRENTEWHNIVLWRGLAEVAEKYLKKGAKVYIEGKLRTRSYEDKEGVTKYTTEIVADNMIMLSGRENDGGDQDSASYAGGRSQQQSNAQGGSYGGGRQSQGSSSSSATENIPLDDDLPF